MHSSSALILDAETRSALAIVRSLGKANYYCLTASSKKHAISHYSKWSAKILQSPDPASHPEEYRNWVLNTITSLSPKVLIATTDISIETLAPIENLIREKVSYPVVRKEILDQVQDKFTLITKAKNHGIEVPKSHAFKCLPSELETTLNIIEDELHFPIILKPRRSVQTDSKGELLKVPRKIVSSRAEAKSFISSLDHSLEYLAQNVISGSGIGIFSFFKTNHSIMDFSHTRILEKPPEGGVSVLSESREMDKDLLAKVHSLLTSYAWDGLAMVEFKLDSTGTPYLMEINPRPWGSLQLAIDSGCDFPFSLVSETQIPQTPYTVGLRLRWELGTLDHLIIRMKREGILNSIMSILRNELHLSLRGCKSEIFRLNDPLPFVGELRNYFFLPK